MGIDPWGDLAEIQDGAELPGPVVSIGVDDPVYALSRSPMAVMSAAAVSDTAADWHIEKTGKQYFGYILWTFVFFVIRKIPMLNVRE